MQRHDCMHLNPIPGFGPFFVVPFAIRGGGLTCSSLGSSMFGENGWGRIALGYPEDPFFLSCVCD